MRRDKDFPKFVLAKWQKLIDLLSSTFDLPATLIMQANQDTMEVFASSNTGNNPYVVGDIEKKAGLYCETVIQSEAKLLVPNALNNSQWDRNPDIKLGMIAYLGFPLMYPDGEIFGTICVLDNKENSFNETIEEFLIQVQGIIELDIAAYSLYEQTSNKLKEKKHENFQIDNKNERSLYNLEVELDKQKHIYKILSEKLRYFDDELLKRANKYETLFTSMNSALVFFEAICDQNGDLCDARYLNMNSKNEEIIGYKKEAVIGKTILEIFPETEAIWFSNFDSVLKNKKAINFDLYHKPLGKHFSVNTFQIEESVFGVSYYDITEHVIVKQKLSDSEKRYKTIFNESNSIMLLIDPQSKKVIDANSSAINFYGYPRTKFLGMKMSDVNVMSPEDLQKEVDLATASKKNHFQFKHRLANGDIRDVEVYSGSIIADGQALLHSVIHDVTERRIALEEVNRLSLAVEQSPVSIVITDILGNILYCNPKHCEITGYSDEEMIGLNPRVLKSGKYNKDDYFQLWKSISNGKKWSGEFFNKKKNGSFYWESASIAPIKNDEGKIVNYIKIGEDITDRKRLENQLSQSILKAEESDKLKTSFLSNLSHEVRTPLNGILGFTNLMLSDEITDEERKEYCAFVESSGNQLMMMMDDILKISTIEAGKMSVKYSTFNIKELLHEIKVYYSQEINEKNLDFKIDCNCESLIYNDQKRVRQIFDNLIRNAIKFTEKGKITLKAECNEEMVILAVQDTGIGIARENQVEIFERFRQLDNFTTREFEGTGLGLAISKEIITLLGGEIWVESELGKGSKFIFTIPKMWESDK